MTTKTALQHTSSNPIYSSSQAHKLHHQFFDPKDNTKATLLIVHGMCEYGERYTEFAQFLANHGIAVAIYDQLGHGQTVNNPDELGFFHDKHPIQSLAKDVIIMANALKNRHHQVPHFIMGHSMGSLIVRYVLRHHFQDFSGAILMGTLDKNIFNHILPPIAQVFNHFAPKQPNHLLQRKFNQFLNAKLINTISASEFAWLSENIDNINRYENDPQCNFSFTNKGFATLFTLANQATKSTWGQTIDKTFPMLFISGNNDPLSNMGKDIINIVQQLRKQKFQQIDYRLYPNMRHEPLHEQQKHLVYEDILNWLLAK